MFSMETKTKAVNRKVKLSKSMLIKIMKGTLSWSQQVVLVLHLEEYEGNQKKES